MAKRLNRFILPFQLSTSVILLAVSSIGHANDPFTIVVLPDTQNYSTTDDNAMLFNQQTQWIANQIQQDSNPRNIQFVTHMGDIVNYGGSLNQWRRADEAMDILDGVVKYSVVPGNHDFMTIADKSAGSEYYLDNFGPQRFAGEEWYGGTDTSGNNSYQRINAGGYDFIHLAMEWQPTENIPYRDTSPIEWAQSVIDANPSTPVILSTHEYLNDSSLIRSSYGNALWDQLVRKNDQIFMVLNGHFQNGNGTDDGEQHQITINDAGRPVFEVVQDFQDYANGGDGWLRLINFDIPNNQIAFETYSPVLDEFQTERVDEVGSHASQFEFDIDFASRLSPMIPSPVPDLVFQNGVNGYLGTRDKELRYSGNDATIGQATSIRIDGNNNGTTEVLPIHGLIGFDNIVGFGPGQLSPDVNIEQALLVLEVLNPGSGFSVHEMLANWDENSTWQSFADGVQADGVEAAVNPLTIIGANNSSENIPVGRLEIDVTSSVEAYLDGTIDELSWALLPFIDGINGIDFSTSEYADAEMRPSLLLHFSDGLVQGDFDHDGDVDSADFTVWESRFGVSTEATGHDFLEWQRHFGNGEVPSAIAMLIIPEPSTVVLLCEMTVLGVLCRRGRGIV